MIDLEKLDKVFKELRNDNSLKSDLYCYRKEASEILDSKHPEYVQFYKKVRKINKILDQIISDIGSLLNDFNINSISLLNNLVIVGYEIHRHGSVGYEEFNKLVYAGMRPQHKEEYELIDRLTKREGDNIYSPLKYKIKSIRFYYHDDQKPFEISNSSIISRIRDAIKDKFLNNPELFRYIPIIDRDKKKLFFKQDKRIIEKDFGLRYKGKKTDPYGDYLKFWTPKIDKYLQCIIDNQEIRYPFIDKFFRISGMPIVNLKGKEKGQPISQDKAYDHIKDTYL